MKADYESAADSVAIELSEFGGADHGVQLDGAVVHRLKDEPVAIDILDASKGLKKKISAVAEDTGLDADSLEVLARTAIANPNQTVAVSPLPEHSGKFMARVPPSLHAKLAKSADSEGISLNAFVTAALAGAVNWRTLDLEPTPSGPAARYLENRSSWVTDEHGKIELQALNDGTDRFAVYLLIDGYYPSMEDAEGSRDAELPKITEAFKADGIAAWRGRNRRP